MDPKDLPDDVETLKALLIAAQAEATRAAALASATEALIAHQNSSSRS